MVTPEADWNVQTFTDSTMSIAANSLEFVGRSQHESTAMTLPADHTASLSVMHTDLRKSNSEDSANGTAAGRILCLHT
jgi:hypothetical protein